MPKAVISLHSTQSWGCVVWQHLVSWDSTCTPGEAALAAERSSSTASATGTAGTSSACSDVTMTTSERFARPRQSRATLRLSEKPTSSTQARSCGHGTVPAREAPQPHHRCDSADPE